MIQWIKRFIGYYNRLKTGKAAGIRLVKRLSRDDLIAIIEEEKSGNFYNESYIRTRGNALHSHYLGKFGTPPIFPEIHGETNDTVAAILWDWFIFEAKKAVQ